MRLFDARLRGAGKRPIDLENLAFFGVEGAVLSVPMAPRAGGPEAVLARFDDLLGPTLARMEVAGVSARCQVGVHPAWTPPRGLHKVLHKLPNYLSRPEVVGVGEIGLSQGTPPEVDLLRRHLELAAAASLPVVLVFPRDARDRYGLAELALDTVLSAGFPTERVLVADSAPDLHELVQAAGARAGVTVGADEKVRRAAVEFLAEMGPDGLIVDGGLGPEAGDVLSIPKAAADMREIGWTEGEVRRVFWDNGVRFFEPA